MSKERLRANDIRFSSKNPRNFMSKLLQKRREDKVNLSLAYLTKLYEGQDGKCAISGIPMTHQHGLGKVHTNISIDRINPQGKYEEGNVQLVCMIVNRMKWTMPMPEFLDLCQIITKRQKTDPRTNCADFSGNSRAEV